MKSARIVRFIVSGCLAALVYLFAFVGLINAGARPFLGGVVAYIIAMPVSFILHKIYTFGSGASYIDETWRFVAASIFGVVLASGVPELLMYKGFLGSEISAALTCIITPCATYVVLRAWVFGGDKNG